MLVLLPYLFVRPGCRGWCSDVGMVPLLPYHTYFYAQDVADGVPMSSSMVGSRSVLVWWWYGAYILE